VSVFNGDDDFNVEKVTPIEANVVLVSRPGDLPQTADERSVPVGNTDSARRTADDSGNAVSCQSTLVPRRPRKRSSFCNNVDELVVDVQSGQSDALTTGRKTSVSHQRHTDAADREHRPKRKGNISMIFSYIEAQ